MTTTETGRAPVLSTRIPEGRTLAGIEYGAHVQRDGWSGYHVRAPACTQWGIARQIPASDELAGTDRDIAIALAEELERHEREHFDARAGTAADRFAVALDHDGQRFETPEGTPFDALAERMGATVQIWREYPDGSRERVPRSDAATSDAVRYLFPDGSAIVAQGDGWDHEGDLPRTRGKGSHSTSHTGPQPPS